ncbi:TPA: hypothetical protein ACGO44_002013 [Streptococcus suis]
MKKSFKEQVVKLFDEIGVKAGANQLESLTILFHLEKSAKKYRADTYVGSGHKRISADNKEQRILELEKEKCVTQTFQ